MRKIVANLVFSLVMGLMIVVVNLLNGMIDVPWLSNFWQNCWADIIVCVSGLPLAYLARKGYLSWRQEHHQ